MDADRLEALYERARSLAPSQREAFLTAECSDPAIRAEIESLLEGAEEAERLFDTLIEAESRIDYGRELSQQVQVGEYQIVERLGAGGMGAVFLARRTVLGVEQRVAVKIVRPGQADPKLEGRLLDEGRLLARLDHPGIARFIDGGLTADGLPYFAMEFVDGVPLIEYCDQFGLAVVERLALFLDVCDAVQYAHQQLVVHRDLKPAHILVESGGRVRLLDFGVARILDPGPVGSRQASHTDVWVTPSHASPEQIRGEPIGTYSDQYSLGIILFELLAGAPPYTVSGRSPSEIERIVCEKRTSSPSQLAVGKLARRLSGDLDNIVLKTLAKEPARRYETVAQLAEDIRDHLTARPVRARSDTWRYRTSRYFRRNRAAVAAAAVVLVSLVAGTALASWQASVATAERDRAQEALAVSEQVRTFITELFWTDRPAGVRGLVSPREFLQRALAQVEDPGLAPAVRAELLDVLGWAHLITADFATGARLLGEAVQLRRQLHPDGHADLAFTLSRFSGAQRRLGMVEEAERSASEALTMQRRLLPPDHPHIAETLIRLAGIRALQQRIPEAIDLKRLALDINRRSAPAGDAAVVSSMQSLAATLNRAGALEEAEQLYRDALTMQEAVHGKDHALVGDAALGVGTFLATEGRADEARALYERALEIHEAAYEEFDPRMAWPLASLGGILVELGEHDQGLALLRRALVVERRNWGDDHLSTAATTSALASAYRSADRFAEAESLYWDVLAIERAALGPRHPQTAGRLIDIAVLRMRSGDLEGAVAPMLDGLSIRRQQGGSGLAGALRSAANLYRRKGDYQTAEDLLQEGLEVAYNLPGNAAPSISLLLTESIVLYSDWGRPGEVERVRELLAAGGEGES